MKLFHTEEEIKNLERFSELAAELKVIGKKFNNLLVLEMSNVYRDIYNTEMNKYNTYIGAKCKTICKETGEEQSCVIIGNFYCHGSIKCTIQFLSQHGITDVISINKLVSY